ncbi:RE1, partial [Symbiodinium natans]
DRTWWKLPNLPDPSTEDACIAVSDWLTQIKPIMSDLSERSWIWWARVMEVAQAAYAKWQQAGPLEKSLVICESPADLLDAKLSRLEARALGMIMESLPARIKDELVVTNVQINCVVGIGGWDGHKISACLLLPLQKGEVRQVPRHPGSFQLKSLLVLLQNLRPLGDPGKGVRDRAKRVGGKEAGRVRVGFTQQKGDARWVEPVGPLMISERLQPKVVASRVALLNIAKTHALGLKVSEVERARMLLGGSLRGRGRAQVLEERALKGAAEKQKPRVRMFGKQMWKVDADLCSGDDSGENDRDSEQPYLTKVVQNPPKNARGLLDGGNNAPQEESIGDQRDAWVVPMLEWLRKLSPDCPEGMGLAALEERVKALDSQRPLSKEREAAEGYEIPTEWFAEDEVEPRLHSDSGREFANAALERWALARDIALTASAVQGFAVAPSVRVPNATVVRIVDEDDQVRLYVAPVVYSHVREPVRFAGVVPADAVVEDYPPPTRRVVGKTPGVAMDARGVEPRGESSEGSARVEVPGRSSEGSARVESARVEVHGRSEGSARVEVPGRSEGSARVEVPGRSLGGSKGLLAMRSLGGPGSPLALKVMGMLRYGMYLLARDCVPQRYEIEDILRRAMHDFQAKGRAIDIDRNMKGSKNFLVPISRFEGGSIVKEEVRVKAAASQFGRDPQRFDISSDSEDDSFAGEWQGCGEPNHEEFVDRLTQLTREEKKAMCEEIEGGLSCVTPGLLSELHEDLRVAMLFQDHDCCERAVELERGSFALHRLKSVERELEEAWQELENTGLPCVRAVRTSGADLVEASAGERGNDLLAGEQPQELHPDFGQDTQEMKAKGAHSPPGVLLQTRIVPQAEVWQDLERWRQPLTDEVVALKDVHRAVYAIGPEELKRLEELAEVSLIPAKGVYTQKPITNRLRARIVGCGNFLQSDSPSEDVAKGTVRSQDLYAGGVDGTSVRIQACVAAINKWHNAGLDIKTAFLDAPLYQDGQGHAVLTPGDVGSGALDFERLVGKRKHVQGQRVKIVVVTPPKILVKLNLVEESERWLVIKALYGLQQAPRCWSSHRDLALRSLQWSDGGRDFRLSQTVAEPNLWRVISSSSEADQEGERLHGLLGVYVDDLLLTMEESVQQRLISEIQRLWATSDPESAEVGKPIRFCGFNLHKLPSGGYLLNQQDYIRDLLNRFPDVQGTAEVPCLRDETPEPEAPNPKQLKEAQMLAGALQWVTTRTRPDIAFSVNKTAQLMARFPEYATRYAQNIIKYLRRTADLVLKYEPLTGASDYGMSGELAAPRSPGLIEVYSDASFAPNNSKSQTGIVASLSGCIIGWASHRQSVTSQSSAEAEMYSTSDGILYIQTLEALVREICPGPVRKLLYSDSMGSVSLYSAPSGTWRTRHLRLKARGGRELLEEGFFELRHLAGRWMLADIATKALHPPRHNELVQLLVMDVPSGSAGGEVKLERCHVVSGNSRDGSLGSSGIRVDLLAMVSLRLLVIGVALANAASKWEMNTDEEANHDESVRLAALAGMLVIVAVLLLQRWCQFAERSEEPNQQVRAMRTDDSDDWPAVEEAAEDERPRDVRRSVSGSVPRSVDGLEPGVRDRSSAGLPQASEFTGVREAQAPEFTGVREAQALGYTGVGESEAPRISRIDLEQQAVEDVRVH